MKKIKEAFNKIKMIFLKCLLFCQKFIKKENFLKIKLLILPVASLLMATALEYTIFRRWYPEFISKNRIMLVTLIITFIGLHFILKLKEMYEWIHKNRYKIAFAFLLFVMIFKYSGSSIVNFNTEIQPNNDNTRYHTLLGKARRIRTDEWATSTTYILSQGEGQNKFDYFSNKLRGTMTDMFTLTNSPVQDILMIGKPFQIAFLLFGNDVGLSFYWYARITAMILGAYELCLILTNKNKKISLCGAIVITFSAAVQWWYCMDTLIWGQIILVLVNKFMNTDKKCAKYFCALGLISALLAYVFVMYPAWQVSFAYVFLAIGIWMLIKNFKNGYKLTKHDILVIIITIACVIALLGRWYNLSKDTIFAVGNTAYPGERCETGGGAYNLFAYIYNIFFTFEEFPNPCEFSSMLSFYPIPMILGLIYVVRNKKNISFWIPALISGGFLAIWCKWGFPEILAKITLMSNATSSRASIALGTLNIYMLIYLMGSLKKEDKWFSNKKINICLAGVATIYILYMSKRTCIYPEYIDKFKMLASGEIFMVAIFGILNINDEKIKDYLIYGLIAIALITGLRVNPVIRTTDVITTKPVALKMQEIRNQEPDSIWIVNDYGWYINDYALANGIRTLNSTNVYPNLEMYETILGEEADKYEEIYNRYSHVMFNIIDEETNVELVFADNVAVNLNYKELEKLNIKYILSKEDINKKGFDKDFEEIYNEDGLYIFKVE